MDRRECGEGCIMICNDVTLPRDEYDRLLRSASVLDVLRTLYLVSGKYAVADLAEGLFNGDLSQSREGDK